MNSAGFSELDEPMRLRERHYPRAKYMLIIIIRGLETVLLVWSRVLIPRNTSSRQNYPQNSSYRGVITSLLAQLFAQDPRLFFPLRELSLARGLFFCVVGSLREQMRNHFNLLYEGNSIRSIKFPVENSLLCSST